MIVGLGHMKDRPQPARHRRLSLSFGVAVALLATPLSPAPAQEPPPAGGNCSSGEVVSQRTRDMKVFLNSDCTYTATFGHYLHYEAAPGQWEEVDLTFHQQGQDYVMDRHELSVRVHGAALEIIDRESGKGIRWLTPGAPAVAGRAARFQHMGLDWRYTTRKTGVKLEAAVGSPLGPRTYEFNYHLLGDPADLVVDPDGNLVSDAFTIPRSVALGSDGGRYVAGGWRLLPGSRAAFDFDDSALPPEAVPYVLDPTTTFDLGGPDAQTLSGAESGDDGMVEAWSSVYPPLNAYEDSSSTYIAVRREDSGFSYGVSNGLMRWDTSTLPDSARIVSAELLVSTAIPWNQDGFVPGCPVANNDRRYLTADWYSAWPIDPTDYSPTAWNGALAGVSLDTFIETEPHVVIPFDNTDGVSTTGYTGLRLHISGGQPTGRNSVCFAAFDNTELPEPRLAVTYVPDPPVVTGVVDSPDPALGGDQVTFYVSFLRVENGERHRALICASPFLNRLNGTCQDGAWATGLYSDEDTVTASMWTGPNSRGPVEYYAFVCNDSVCSLNWREGTWEAKNRHPVVGKNFVLDSPDPAIPGEMITFSIDSTDTTGDPRTTFICATDEGLTGTWWLDGPPRSCVGGTWATATSHNCTGHSPPATTECTSYAYYTPGQEDGGTYDYWAYVCDNANSCDGPRLGTLTVDDGSGGGGGPCLLGAAILCRGGGGGKSWQADNDCSQEDNLNTQYFSMGGPAGNWNVWNTGVGGCHIFVATVCVQGCAVTNTASWYLPVNFCCYYRVKISIADDDHFNSNNVRYQRFGNGTVAGVSERYGVNQQGADPGYKCVTCGTQRAEDPYTDADGFQQAGYMKMINESSDHPDYAGVDQMKFRFVA